MLFPTINPNICIYGGYILKRNHEGCFWFFHGKRQTSASQALGEICENKQQLFLLDVFGIDFLDIDIINSFWFLQFLRTLWLCLSELFFGSWVGWTSDYQKNITLKTTKLVTMLLMAEILHQLRLVVEIPLFTRFYTSQVVQDFSHQQYWCNSFFSFIWISLELPDIPQTPLTVRSLHVAASLASDILPETADMSAENRPKPNRKFHLNQLKPC